METTTAPKPTRNLRFEQPLARAPQPTADRRGSRRCTSGGTRRGKLSVRGNVNMRSGKVTDRAKWKRTSRRPTNEAG